MNQSLQLALHLEAQAVNALLASRHEDAVELGLRSTNKYLNQTTQMLSAKLPFVKMYLVYFRKKR